MTNPEQRNISKIKDISKVIIDFMCYEQTKTVVSPGYSGSKKVTSQGKVTKQEVLKVLILVF